MDWKALILMIASVVLSSNKKTSAMVPFVVSGIQTAEDMLGKTGP
jgi:hypothetical protein